MAFDVNIICMSVRWLMSAICKAHALSARMGEDTQLSLQDNTREAFISCSLNAIAKNDLPWSTKHSWKLKGAVMKPTSTQREL